ncbi:MAG: radical SAM protein [Rhizobiaceae bacterium]
MLTSSKMDTSNATSRRYDRLGECFSFPYKDAHIVYLPLDATVYITKSVVVEALSKYNNGGSELTDKETELVERIKVSRQGSSEPRLGSEPASEPASEFKPTSVTLSTSAQCSMRCIYCYANAGDFDDTMPWEIAKAAIDLVANNAVETDQDVFEVGFHGEGEPTHNWSLLKQCVEYAEKVADQLKKKPVFSLCTNGILSKSKIHFLADHQIGFTASVDGIKEVQDLQRPLRKGAGSFGVVLKTLQQFDRLGHDYSIRATVTKLGVDKMAEFVEFLAANLKVKDVFFEPVSSVGRGLGGDLGVDPSRFIAEFRKSKALGAAMGINVGYSALKTDQLTNTFCGAVGPVVNFMVTSTGTATSCYEVLTPEDPRSKDFIYGRFDKATSKFSFNKKMLKNLEQFSVQNRDACKDCFVRWHCAGDCLARAAQSGDLINHVDPVRCEITKQLSADELVRAVLNNEFCSERSN